MPKTERNIHFVLLFLLGCRLAFIFSHATTSPAISNMSSLTGGGAELKVQQGGLSNNQTAAISEIFSGVISQTPQEPTEQIMESVQEKINLSEDINVLEAEYQKAKDPKIAKTLIEKLAQNYEFEKANKYLQEIIANPEYDQSIDPVLHLYIAIHDPTIVSITDPQSIQKIIPIMNEYKTQGRLGVDDYNFYQGLIKLRYKEYKGAWEIFNGIHNPRYTKIIQSVTQAIAAYDSSKAIPKYYQDGLVALSLLKNGYFSIAKKLALDTALEDNKYILPYQILAYTHFLTNNREAANDYFLKLADVDSSNKNLYKFLIGISFYRSKEYDQSILYLSQVTEGNLQGDAYRYMLLSYAKNDDIKSMTNTRQKLLGQTGMTESDYYDYFYQAFYKPYSLGESSKIYAENPLLADMYLTSCANAFSVTQADICSYGQIGLNTTKRQITMTQIPEILRLANKYKESYLFSILGDIYLQTNKPQEAKQNFAKALSIATNTTEKTILQTKISQIGR